MAKDQTDERESIRHETEGTPRQTTDDDGIAEERGEAEARGGGGEQQAEAQDGTASEPSGEPAGEDVAAALQQALAERDAARSERDQWVTSYQQLRDAYARLQADFDNFRRRTREEENRRKLEAAADVIRDLLPVVDNMERAVQAAEAGEPEADGRGETPDADARGGQVGLRSGVVMILQQLRGVLEKHGVTPVPGVGAPFDPRWHHAVAREELQRTDEAASDSGGEDRGGDEASAPSDAPLVVVEEFQKGYLLGDRVIRPGMVKVGIEAPGEDRG